LKIVIIEPNAHFAGHYSQELHSFCQHLAPRVESVVLLTPHGFRDEWLMRGYGHLWSFYKSARKVVRELDPDIIHVWGYFSVFPMWFFLRDPRWRGRIVITVKSVRRIRDPILGSQSVASLQGRIADFLLARLASRYVVHTQEMFQQAVGIGIDPSLLRIIPTGIEEGGEGVTREMARARLDLGLDFSVVLLFGVWREEKGIMETLSFVRGAPRMIRFVVAGEDWTDGALQKRIVSLGIQDRVSLHLGYVPESEVEGYFRASDVVLIGHRPEFAGESGVLLRAMEFGIPVLVCEGSHAASVVQSKKIGAIFEFGNAQSFSRSLAELTTLSSNARADMQENIQKIRKERSWSVLMRSYLQMYESLCPVTQT
jgi:glycosyltransferase involved in cell wall biosynthesis